MEKNGEKRRIDVFRRQSGGFCFHISVVKRNENKLSYTIFSLFSFENPANPTTPIFVNHPFNKGELK